MVPHPHTGEELCPCVRKRPAKSPVASASKRSAADWDRHFALLNDAESVAFFNEATAPPRCDACAIAFVAVRRVRITQHKESVRSITTSRFDKRSKRPPSRDSRPPARSRAPITTPPTWPRLDGLPRMACKVETSGTGHLGGSGGRRHNRRGRHRVRGHCRSDRPDASGIQQDSEHLPGGQLKSLPILPPAAARWLSSRPSKGRSCSILSSSVLRPGVHPTGETSGDWACVHVSDLSSTSAMPLGVCLRLRL